MRRLDGKFYRCPEFCSLFGFRFRQILYITVFYCNNWVPLSHCCILCIYTSHSSVIARHGIRVSFLNLLKNIPQLNVSGKKKKKIKVIPRISAFFSRFHPRVEYFYNNIHRVYNTRARLIIEIFHKKGTNMLYLPS